MPINKELADYVAAQEGLDPNMLSMVMKAMSPETAYSAKVDEMGKTTINYISPEVKAAEEEEKAQAQPVKEGQPKGSKNIGYGPAMAAMTAPSGEPVSEAELRGLTPEQIIAVMSGEARSEQLRQGTIGQLMELPYRQALTEKALRPEMTPEQTMTMARIQKSLNPLQQFALMKGLTQWQTHGKLFGKTLDELKEMYVDQPWLFEGAPKDIVDQITKEEEKLEERMYQDDKGEYWWGLFEPGATTPSRPKLRKATKRDIEHKEIEVSPLAREKFERMKEMDAATARKWIADNPKLPENKEYVHQANRDSKDSTLYVWEKPGIIFGGKAVRVELPEGFLAGHFEPSMTEALQEGETIGPFAHPKTGERTMLKIVEGEVVIVEE